MTRGCSTTTTDSKPRASICPQNPAIQSGSAHTPDRTGGSAAILSVVTSVDLLGARRRGPTDRRACSTVGQGTVVAPVEAQLALGEPPHTLLDHELVLITHGH